MKLLLKRKKFTLRYAPGDRLRSSKLTVTTAKASIGIEIYDTGEIGVRGRNGDTPAVFSSLDRPVIVYGYNVTRRP